MVETDAFAGDQLVDELTEWTTWWMTALPVPAGRALAREELDALKYIFKRILETRKVDVMSIPLPDTM
jgi:hypothetical protein